MLSNISCYLRKLFGPKEKPKISTHKKITEWYKVHTSIGLYRATIVRTIIQYEDDYEVHGYGVVNQNEEKKYTHDVQLSNVFFMSRGYTKLLKSGDTKQEVMMNTNLIQYYELESKSVEKID